MANINPADIVIYAEQSDEFKRVAEECLDGWYDVFSRKAGHFELGQVVYCKGFGWLGAFMWRRTRRRSYSRDLVLGWHACQQAERIPLVIECVAFQPRLHSSGIDPCYGIIALQSAVEILEQQWLDFFGYRPLLVETNLAPKSGFWWMFQKCGWTRTTDKHPRVTASHWLRELVPGAKAIITARDLDKAYAGGPGTPVKGILPVDDALLESFRDAFKDVDDPRKDNRHFSLGSVLALTFLALMCGGDSISAMTRFSTRLSDRQAELLGLPWNKTNNCFDLPNYHVYYRTLDRVDRLKAAECLLKWLEANLDALPEILHHASRLVPDMIATFVQHFSRPPPRRTFDFDDVEGLDPDAPDWLKRDADGNLIP